MTEPTIFALARQGDPAAISSLLQGMLQPIQVQVSRQDETLRFLLEGSPLPDQATAVALLKQWLATLGHMPVQQVVIGARQPHQEELVWEQTVDLDELTPLTQIPETAQPSTLFAHENWQEPAIAVAEPLDWDEAIHRVGEVVGDRYRIEGVLGQGGNGTTYRAEDTQTGTIIALKVISLQSMTTWKELELFEREVQTLKQLDHPRIPKYLDTFEIDKPGDRRFYIVQQLVEGTSLAALVKQGWRTNEAGIRQIAIQVLQILIYLQQFTPPIVHRDVTPQNLIRQPDGTIFLVDFGAAKTTVSSLSSVGSTFVGTHGYMAPEQFQGRAFPATDLFGLSATLLFLLTHRHPADLPHDGLKVRFRSRLQVSDHFADWLEKLLEPEVSDRYLLATDALNALEQQQLSRKRRKSILRWVFAGLALAVTGISSFVIYQYRWDVLKFLGIGAPGVCRAIEHRNYSTLVDFLRQEGDPTDTYGERKNGLHMIIIFFLMHYLLQNDISSDDEFIDEKHRSLLNCALRVKDNGKAINIIVDNIASSKSKKIKENLLRELIISFSDEIDLDITPITRLINKGISINYQDEKLKTPLHHALDSLSIAYFKEQHNKYKTKNYKRWNASIELVKLLVNQGSDLNKKNEDGWTPLSMAFAELEKVSREEVRLYSQTILKNSNPLSALEEYELKEARIHQIELQEKGRKLQVMIKTMLQKGADLNNKLKRLCNFCVTVRLEKRSARVTISPLGIAILVDRMSLAQEIVRRGGSKISQNSYGEALYWAILTRNLKMVRFLIRNHADINARNIKQQTLLHLAIHSLVSNEHSTSNFHYIHDAMKVSSSIQKIVPQETILLDIQDLSDVLELEPIEPNPKYSNIREGIAIVRVLLDSGANVNTKDLYGYTPLDHAFILLKIQQKLCRGKSTTPPYRTFNYCEQAALKEGIRLLKSRK